MSYTGKSIVNTKRVSQEIELLSLGYTYAEISEITGGKHKSIAERNRIVYKINIWNAFRQRIERGGIPNRLSISDDFGHWLVGLTDGEGHFGFFVRYKIINGIPSPDYTSLFQIVLRDDDAQTIKIIKDELKVGNVNFGSAGDNPRWNPKVGYYVRSQKDLAEVIIPLFDRYPLRTRKAEQFIIWKRAIIELYIRTLGGYSNRKAVTKEENTLFESLAQQLREARAYAAVS